MPTSSIVATRTSSTPIHKSETSSILSKPSLSFKTTPFVKSTQSPSIAVFSSPSTPILQTSAAHSQTIRPLKTTRMSYLTVTPSESLVSFKTQDSSFAIKISSSYESYKIRSSSRIRSSFVVGPFLFDFTCIILILNPKTILTRFNLKAFLGELTVHLYWLLRKLRSFVELFKSTGSTLYHCIMPIWRKYLVRNEFTRCLM